MSAKLLSLVLAFLSIAAMLSVPSGAPAAAAPAWPAPAAPAAASLAVDGGHSSLVFRVKHFETAYFYGRFNKISGDVLLEEKNGSVTIEIDADSIDTNSAP